MNATLWVVWAFTTSHHYGRGLQFEIPWPLWVTFFWGLGLIRRGIGAYGGFTYEQRTQREYDRLARRQVDPLDRYR